MKKWIIAILAVLVVMTMMSESPKKEGRFSFRCGDNNESVEIYNKETLKFVTWEECDDGCEYIEHIPTCREFQKEETSTFNPIPLALIAGLVLIWRMKK